MLDSRPVASEELGDWHGCVLRAWHKGQVRRVRGGANVSEGV